MARTRADAGIDQIARLSEPWDALADRVGASPFLRPGWIAAWWRAFGRGRLEILSMGGDGRLDAVLPVVQRDGGIHAPSNWHTPQYGLLAAAEEARAELLARLFAGRAPQVSLGFVSTLTGELDELVRAADGRRYVTLVRPLERSLLVRVQGDWEAYQRSLSGNLRRDLGRCRRRLGELGRVWLDVRDDASRLEEAFALERTGWKQQAGTAIASRSQTRRFYTEVAHWAAQRGCLRLIFLRVDERAVAFQLAFQDGRAHLSLKSGFDPTFGAMSPGRLIIHASLEHAFATGLERFEFLGDAEPYKRRWANDAYQRMLFQAFSRAPAGRMLHAAFAYGRPVAKRALTVSRRALAPAAVRVGVARAPGPRQPARGPAASGRPPR